MLEMFHSLRHWCNLGALLDEVDGGLDGGDLLNIFLGDLDLELLLEGHDKLDGVKGVGIKVGHETGGVVEVTLDIKLALDDVANALLDVVGGHVEGGSATKGGTGGGGEGGGASHKGGENKHLGRHLGDNWTKEIESERRVRG